MAMLKAIFTIALLLLAFSPALAENLYLVKDVAVTVPATDTGAGRPSAMFEAQKKAFDELQKKFLASGYIKAKKSVQGPQIQALVDTIDVVSEKIGLKEYKGIYNVTFSRSAISKLYGIDEVTDTSDNDKFLVVPITSDADHLKIWKNDWSAYFEKTKHADIILPLGDLQDVQSLREEDVKAKKYTGAFRLQKRYGATALVLVTAQFMPDSNVLAVELQKIKDQERTTVNYEYPSDTGVTLENLYAAAAEDIIYRLEKNKLADTSLAKDVEKKLPEPYSPNAPGAGYIGEKKYPAPDKAIPWPADTVDKPPVAQSGGNVTEISVIAPDLIAWNRIRSKITNTPGINDLKIKSLVSGKASITISHNVDMPALTEALAAQELLLTNDSGGWQIKEKP